MQKVFQSIFVSEDKKIKKKKLEIYEKKSHQSIIVSNIVRRYGDRQNRLSNKRILLCPAQVGLPAKSNLVFPFVQEIQIIVMRLINECLQYVHENFRVLTK